MAERNTGLSKEAVLRTLSKNIKEMVASVDAEKVYTCQCMVDKCSILAKDMGATDFEITDIRFSSIPEEDRQGLFETYCLNLKNNPVKSVEDIEKWAKDLMEIKKKYNLKDPYTSAKTSETNATIGKPAYRNFGLN